MQMYKQNIIFIIMSRVNMSTHHLAENILNSYIYTVHVYVKL